MVINMILLFIGYSLVLIYMVNIFECSFKKRMFGIILGWILIFGSFFTPVVTKEVKYDLVALSSNSVYNGQFFLGTGRVGNELQGIFAKMAKITDEQIDAWEQEIILTNHPTYPAKDFQSCVRDKINKIRDIMKELEKVKEVFDYDAEIDRLKSEHDFIAFSGDGECENCNGWDMESDRCECGCCRVCWMVEDDYVYASAW